MSKVTFTLISFFCLFLCGFSPLQAQSGEYDARFTLYNFSCDDHIIFMDIQVRSTSMATVFNMSDQNYRFSFNEDAMLPVIPSIGPSDPNPNDRSIKIDTELVISGFVQAGGSNSFYNTHTLVGSIDSVGSYNVALAGGDGYPVDTAWVSVGRLRLQLLSSVETLNLVWHTHAPEDFPPTFIGEKFNGQLFEAAEGAYFNAAIDFANLCGGNLPIELSYFDAYADECSAVIEWETASEENNDFFLLERSTDGLKFDVIKKTDGAGNSSLTISYRYVDEEALPTNYYRLRQVDFDGTTTVSEQKVVRTACYDESILNGITAIYPNPVFGSEASLQFYTDREGEQADIVISDVLGRVVSQQSVLLSNGPNTLTFSTPGLMPGTYFARIVGENWFSQTQKFVNTGQ